MARYTFTAILALAASVQATFKIPPGTPDGVYGVTIGEDVGLTHASFAKRYSLDKRTDGPKCVDSGAVLVRNDINQAQYALADACDANGDEFIPAKGDRYSKFGNAVVYVCNYGVKTQHCYSSELNDDLAEVEAKCGDVAGYYSRFSSWKKTYGIEDVDNGFC
ncbi:hypothetical protein MBLNU13_g09713t2 [Cladosporium sp. NU13]